MRQLTTAEGNLTKRQRHQFIFIGHEAFAGKHGSGTALAHEVEEPVTVFEGQLYAALFPDGRAQVGLREAGGRGGQAGTLAYLV